MVYLLSKYNDYRSKDRQALKGKEFEDSLDFKFRDWLTTPLLWERIKILFLGIYESSFKYLKSLRRINIKLSLGYNDLKEIDVLRLVANSILSNYEQLRWDYWPIGVVRFAFSFLMIFIFYYFSGIHSVVEEAKVNSELVYLLPTQGFHYVDEVALRDLKVTSPDAYTEILFKQALVEANLEAEAGLALDSIPDAAKADSLTSSFLCAKSTVLASSTACRLYGDRNWDEDWRGPIRNTLLRVDWTIFLLYEKDFLLR